MESHDSRRDTALVRHHRPSNTAISYRLSATISLRPGTIPLALIAFSHRASCRTSGPINAMVVFTDLNLDVTVNKLWSLGRFCWRQFQSKNQMHDSFLI